MELETKEEGVFTVKFCYNVLVNFGLLDVVVSREEEKVFAYIWKSTAPSKVVVFS